MIRGIDGLNFCFLFLPKSITRYFEKSFLMNTTFCKVEFFFYNDYWWNSCLPILYVAI